MNLHNSEAAMVDIAVIGKGPIGAAAALMAERLGVSVAWLGRESAQVAPVCADAKPSAQGWDSRVYALSAAARTLLGELRVWDALAQDRIAPVYDMRIYPVGSDPVELHFGAYEGNIDALAWIVEDSNLNSGLHRAIGFSRIRDVNAQMEGLELMEGTPATLWLDEGSCLRARLVIHRSHFQRVAEEVFALPDSRIVVNAGRHAQQLLHGDGSFAPRPKRFSGTLADLNSSISYGHRRIG